MTHLNEDHIYHDFVYDKENNRFIFQDLSFMNLETGKIDTSQKKDGTFTKIQLSNNYIFVLQPSNNNEGAEYRSLKLYNSESMKPHSVAIFTDQITDYEIYDNETMVILFRNYFIKYNYIELKTIAKHEFDTENYPSSIKLFDDKILIAFDDLEVEDKNFTIYNWNDLSIYDKVDENLSRFVSVDNNIIYFSNYKGIAKYNIFSKEITQINDNNIGFYESNIYYVDNNSLILYDEYMLAYFDVFSQKIFPIMLFQEHPYDMIQFENNSISLNSSNKLVVLTQNCH